MKNDFDRRLEELYIDLPEPPTDRGSVTGTASSGKLLYVSGAIPYASGRVHYTGRAGVELTLDTAKLAARSAAVLAISQAWHALGGSLRKVKRVLRMDGYIASSVDFKDHAKVLDGASDLLGDIFGPGGKHARSAVGVASLPQNACVSLSIVFELK